MKAKLSRKSEPQPINDDLPKEFLFSRTILETHKNFAERQGSYAKTRVLSDQFEKRFSSLFPHIPYDQAFVDLGLEQMGSSHFTVFVIREDIKDKISKQDSYADDFLLNVGMVLEKLTKPIFAVWGLIKPHTLGFFLPETDPETDIDKCMSLGSEIRGEIAKLQKETVSIGIAFYPAYDFSRTDTVPAAIKALNHAVIIGAGSTVVFDSISLNISGDELYQEGDFHGAIKEYQKALELDSLNPNIHNSLGVCYGVLEMYDDAETHFNEAILLKPDEVMAIYNIGLVCLLTGRNDKALELFEKASSMGDEIFEPALFSGKLCLNSGYPEKAITFLKKAIDFRPKSGVALRTLASCFSALNRQRDAVAVYTKAVKNNPNDAESLSMLGHLYDVIGENPEIAILFCRQSVEIDPENEVYRERLENLSRKYNTIIE